MKVFLRADSSLSIGSGHIIRCLNLATALRMIGAQCVFISKNHRGNIISRIEHSGFLAEVIPVSEEPNNYVRNEKDWLNGSQTEDAKQFLSFIKRKDEVPDIVIVDHYSLDSEWEIIIKKEFPSAKLVVIDDLCNRPHYCDLLIDQTYQRSEIEYADLNCNAGNVLAGTKYALLNPAFSRLRNQSIANKMHLESPQKLMITMGGVDANNITGKILRYLDEMNFENIEKITVVLGSACPHSAEIYELAAGSKYAIDVLINVENMAELMLEHDFAIGAMGGTTWERCVMALPAVNIAIADNQCTIAHNLSKAGAIVLHSDDFSKDEFHDAFSRLITSYHRQREIAETICDGQGLMRDIQEMVPCPAKDGVNVTLRIATIDDIEFVYKLQCEPQTRQFARNPEIPSLENHTVWMRRKLLESDNVFYIIEHKFACGVLRLDPIEHPNAELEISIFLTANCIGKGVASAAIKRALMLHRHKKVLATVLPENIASHKLFESIGFKKISSSEYVSEKNDE